jgi:biofilm PGA synthesis N-glycosyltransferase PgaC
MIPADYVLVTPARNEDAVIGDTIRSVVAQTVLPRKWIIVSDGSTDRTDEIVLEIAREYKFIMLLRRSEGGAARGFDSKVRAFREGCEQLHNLNYDFIGNLDADVTFAPNYFESVFQQFRANPRLGVAGGIVHELVGDNFIPQRISLNSVAGAVQTFRRECYERIGGYVPLRYGGIDSAAEIMARMHGWKVQTFPQFEVRHHRRVASGSGGLLKREWRHGLRHYSLGYHPLFELLRNAYKLPERPYVVGAGLMTLGYLWAFATGRARELPEETVRYLQAEQRERLISMVRKSSPWHRAAKSGPEISK